MHGRRWSGNAAATKYMQPASAPRYRLFPLEKHGSSHGLRSDTFTLPLAGHLADGSGIVRSAPTRRFVPLRDTPPRSRRICPLQGIGSEQNRAERSTGKASERRGGNMSTGFSSRSSKIRLWLHWHAPVAGEAEGASADRSNMLHGRAASIRRAIIRLHTKKL